MRGIYDGACFVLRRLWLVSCSNPEDANFPQGHGILNMPNDLIACCVHNGKTGTDGSAKSVKQ